MPRRARPGAVCRESSVSFARKLCGEAERFSAADSEPLRPEMLLEILGQAPIVFHRIFVDITGSVTAALWLSYALYALDSPAASAQGWFGKSQDDWRRDTGLTRREQESARRRLRELGLIVERRGMGEALAFRVDCVRLYALIEAQADNVHADSRGVCG